MLCWDWVSSLTVSLILRMPRSQGISRDLQQRMPAFRGGHCDQDTELSYPCQNRCLCGIADETLSSLGLFEHMPYLSDNCVTWRRG